MSASGVEQLGVLSELFAEVVQTGKPESVAILGVAGGNGLEHIDPLVTSRVVGVDINSEYLGTVRDRYAGRLGLELHCLNLGVEQEVLPNPVTWVHAALLFEHAGLEPCVDHAVRLVAPGGHMSVVLQLPTVTSQNVAATPFASMQLLKHDFSLVDRHSFARQLEARGFDLVQESHRELPGGKAFWMGVFRQFA